MYSVNKGFSFFKALNILALVAACMLFSPTFASGNHPETNETQSTHAEGVDSAHNGHDQGDVHAEAGHGDEHGEKYNANEVVMHHISDAHTWEFFTVGSFHAAISLPIIVYSKENGLDVFLSSAFKAKGDGHDHKAPLYYGNYIMFHEKIYLADANGELVLDENHKAANAKPFDLSITKNVASMMISALLLCLIFISVAKAYAKNGKSAPKGLQSFMEPIIEFVRKDVVQPNMGKHTEKFMPYMLTLFFFIWINNMLGLLPGSANVTGNIALTFFLSLVTLFATLIFAKKDYWGHIFNPPGVPKWLFPIMIPVEIVGIFTKPFALMIRLFANITAGHILILSIIGLIFMFSNNGTSIGAGFGVAVPSLVLTLFLYCIELLVAALQAYIFTMLTALFIGQAMEEHSHDHAEAGH